MFSARARKLTRPGIRFRSLPLSSRISLGVLLVVVLGAVLAPLLTQDPLAMDQPVRAPDAAHLFGTDRAGRDVFARVLHGARYSLVIGLGATAVALLAPSCPRGRAGALLTPTVSPATTPPGTPSGSRAWREAPDDPS